MQVQYLVPICLPIDMFTQLLLVTLLESLWKHHILHLQVSYTSSAHLSYLIATQMLKHTTHIQDPMQMMSVFKIPWKVSFK